MGSPATQPFTFGPVQCLHVSAPQPLGCAIWYLWSDKMEWSQNCLQRTFYILHSSMCCSSILQHGCSWHWFMCTWETNHCELQLAPWVFWPETLFCRKRYGWKQMGELVPKKNKTKQKETTFLHRMDLVWSSPKWRFACQMALFVNKNDSKGNPSLLTSYIFKFHLPSTRMIL